MKNYKQPYFNDFKCVNCHNLVSVDTALSGVRNRNHCPYCLHSRHVDLREAGDRLSACKGTMEPIGLALKKTAKKYGGVYQGELMIVHRCTECNKLSINRIAADDIADFLFEIFLHSGKMDFHTQSRIEECNIQILHLEDEEIVKIRLYGWKRVPSSGWDFANSSYQN